MRHVALHFQNEQVTKGVKPNTVITMMNALGSFCTQNGKVLMLRGKRLRTQIDLKSHIFTNGDLGKMFDIGDTQEKAITATMTSLGWEVSSVLNLKRAKINSLIEKARADKQDFIYFQDQRTKTGALRLGVLNPLAIQWLEIWFREWPGDGVFSYTTKEGVNKMMQRLAKEAQIKTTGDVHTHLIRKWVMSRLSSAGFNDFQIKYVMGKTIPVSDATYLQNLTQQIQERYPDAYEKYLNLKPEKVTIIESPKTKEQEDKIKSLEGTVKRLSDQVEMLAGTIRVIHDGKAQPVQIEGHPEVKAFKMSDADAAELFGKENVQKVKEKLIEMEKAKKKKE
jgi:hypothetical protein